MIKSLSFTFLQSSHFDLSSYYSCLVFHFHNNHISLGSICFSIIILNLHERYSTSFYNIRSRFYLFHIIFLHSSNQFPIFHCLFFFTHLLFQILDSSDSSLLFFFFAGDFEMWALEFITSILCCYLHFQNLLDSWHCYCSSARFYLFHVMNFSCRLRICSYLFDEVICCQIIDFFVLKIAVIKHISNLNLPK